MRKTTTKESPVKKKSNSKGCKCIDQLEQRLIKRFSEQGGTYIEGSMEFNPMAITFGAPDGMRPFLECKFQEEYSTKKGEVKYRKHTNNIMFTYCPFCGREYPSKKR